MRLPIVEYPKIVTASLKHFGPVFQTAAQRQHFCRYVTGLIAGDKGTVQAISNLFLDKPDQSVLNKFVTQEEWSETELNERRIELELARLQRRPVSARAGRLIIDDTLAQHKKGAIEGLAYLKDHTLNRYVWAHDVVTAHYVNRQDQFPVDLRLYQQFRVKYEAQRLRQLTEQVAATPTQTGYQQLLVEWLSYRWRQQNFKTKTTLASEMVQAAVGGGLPFQLVLWDSWFSRRPLIEQVEHLGKDWIGGCPKDRKVLYEGQWQPLVSFIKAIPADAYRPVKLNDQLYWLFAKNLPAQSVFLK
jgi:SRSO17 transposase